ELFLPLVPGLKFFLEGPRTIAAYQQPEAVVRVAGLVPALGFDGHVILRSALKWALECGVCRRFGSTNPKRRSTPHSKKENIQYFNLWPVPMRYSFANGKPMKRVILIAGFVVSFSATIA